MNKPQIVQTLTFSDSYSPQDSLAIYYTKLHVTDNNTWYVIRCSQGILNQLRVILKKGGFGWTFIKDNAKVIYPDKEVGTTSKVEPNLKQEALNYLDRENEEPSNKIKQLLLF